MKLPKRGWQASPWVTCNSTPHPLWPRSVLWSGALGTAGLSHYHDPPDHNRCCVMIRMDTHCAKVTPLQANQSQSAVLASWAEGGGGSDREGGTQNKGRGERGGDHVWRWNVLLKSPFWKKTIASSFPHLELSRSCCNYYLQWSVTLSKDMQSMKRAHPGATDIFAGTGWHLCWSGFQQWY